MSKGSFPSKFIINTDYATLKNDASGTAVITIPDTVNTPVGSDTIYRATLQIGASDGAGYRFYITSSKYNYAITSPAFAVACKESGYDSYFYCQVYRQGKSFVFEAVFMGDDWGTYHYTNSGQTLTLHIQSFISPFDA